MLYNTSLAGTLGGFSSFFNLSEFFLVSFFFCHCCLISSMSVVSLINCKQWCIDGIVHNNWSTQDENLPHPAVLLEYLGEDSPSRLDIWVCVKSRNNLWCSSWKISRKYTESWFDSLGVGNSWIPLWCVFLDIVIKNSSVDHPVVCVI